MPAGPKNIGIKGVNTNIVNANTVLMCAYDSALCKWATKTLSRLIHSPCYNDIHILILLKDTKSYMIL